jgi:hypothetical protein
MTCFESVVYRSQVKAFFFWVVNNGGLSISAARGVLNRKVLMSPFIRLFNHGFLYSCSIYFNLSSVHRLKVIGLPIFRLSIMMQNVDFDR